MPTDRSSGCIYCGHRDCIGMACCKPGSAAPASAAAPAAIPRLPERVIDNLWQDAGLNSWHPEGSQLSKFVQFAHNVQDEVLARLPAAHQPPAQDGAASQANPRELSRVPTRYLMNELDLRGKSASQAKQTDREAFEAVARERGLDLSQVQMEGAWLYSDCNTDFAWWAWQAARSLPRQALTDAEIDDLAEQYDLYSIQDGGRISRGALRDFTRAAIEQHITGGGK